MLALIAFGNGAAGDVASPIVAYVGERAIRYSEVACAAADDVVHRSRTSEQACRDSEQEMFRAEIVGEIHRRACALDGWSPSEADIASHRPPNLKDESLARELAEKAYVLPRAVRRVYAGEEATAVYADVARVLPEVSLDAFRGQVKAYRSLAVVDKFLARDPLVRFRESVDRFAKEVAMQDYLHQRIAQRAEVTSQT